MGLDPVTDLVRIQRPRPTGFLRCHDHPGHTDSARNSGRWPPFDFRPGAVQECYRVVEELQTAVGVAQSAGGHKTLPDVAGRGVADHDRAELIFIQVAGIQVQMQATAPVNAPIVRKPTELPDGGQSFVALQNRRVEFLLDPLRAVGFRAE